jgi:hypothetical protein
VFGPGFGRTAIITDAPIRCSPVQQLRDELDRDARLLPPSVADVLAACLIDDPAGRPANLHAIAARLVDASETVSACGRRWPVVACRWEPSSTSLQEER